MSVNELSQRLGVSVVTIRKYLTKLEQEGSVKRNHGGAVVLESNSNQFNMQQLLNKNLYYKQKIACAAAQLVKSSDVVMVASGSTCCLTAQEICKIDDVIIVTNAISFQPYLHPTPQTRIIYLGGEYNAKTGSTMGSFGIDALSALNIDKLFIGASAVSPNRGILTFEFSDNLMIRTMIERSKEVILVADCDKFGKSAILKLADINDVDIIITNDELDESYAQELLSKNIKLILV